MLEQPDGLAANAQVKHEFERRHVVLGLGQQLHGQEPAAQPELARFEDRAADDAALVAASAALKVQPSLAPKRAADGAIALRAHEALRPARLDERRLAGQMLSRGLCRSRCRASGGVALRLDGRTGCCGLVHFFRDTLVRVLTQRQDLFRTSGLIAGSVGLVALPRVARYAPGRRLGCTRLSLRSTLQFSGCPCLAPWIAQPQAEAKSRCRAPTAAAASAPATSRSWKPTGSRTRGSALGRPGGVRGAPTSLRSCLMGCGCPYILVRHL